MEWMQRHGRNSTVDLTKGPIFKQLLVFSLPLILENLFQQLYNTVDFLIVKRMCSNEAQAAVGVSTSLINLLIGATQGFAVGASVVISRNFGAGKTAAVRRGMHTAAVIGVWLGTLIMMISFLLSQSVLIVMKTPNDVIGEATAYFRVFSVGLLFMVLYNIGSGIFRSVGDNQHPLYALITAVVLNILPGVFSKRSRVTVFGFSFAGKVQTQSGYTSSEGADIAAKRRSPLYGAEQRKRPGLLEVRAEPRRAHNIWLADQRPHKILCKRQTMTV